ncbi:bifunctional glutamate N-acetyltransferase/amino-acid acetyltransferase ArgJ [Pseudokineococcus marinus]|uniref:Arginine biosynthesis bifunctional protein ArgJ n=1 Tax=Pseudokineococcus marinus TaxID=351215 RepID=A0A849BLM7_9ACTN|nr:bifunctional glutamate N-acetyltransferase/amino-acid acetyltransferase ArgJ [Pseudokineococcus marinus]NNH22245.1 bifunctional glutamate N-acetyltransferase/amino-acid acetyltransferase ArgJ [Pseudokineococcus marinus]
MSTTAPAGFRAAGVTAGLKPSGRPDVALVVNDGPLDVLAAVFTSNRCKANPVLWSEVVARTGRGRAVVLNSGGANCYTGPQGFAATHRTAERTAELLGCGAGEVLVCSTGLIGEQLDAERLLAGVDAAAGALSAEGGDDAAVAVMTTDTVPKTSVVERDGWSCGGMAKGAGMLAPALATMLVVLTTDAVVEPADADAALRAATAATFDRLDSDGCQSTNDTVALLASGASGVRVGAEELAAALRPLCADLASQLLSDAEGSEHDVAITVRGAASEADALEVARSVARSNLFKAAVFGRDPNWGRVMAAVGTTSAAFDPAVLDVSFNGVAVCRDGAVGEPRSLVDLSARDVEVVVDLKAGPEEATVWTNDLTHAYVHENSAYST